MAREPEKIAELRRALGAQLAAFRQAAELTQGQLAIPASVDRTTVAHIERGRSRGDQRFWTIADNRCRADGALLAAFHALQAAHQDHEIRTRETQLAEARAKAETLRVTTATGQSRDTDQQVAPQDALANMIAFTGADLTEGLAAPLAFLTFLDRAAEPTMPTEWLDQIHDQLTRFLRGWANTMNRRKLLEKLGWAAAVIAASPVLNTLDPEEQERLTRALVTPSRVDERVINHLDAILQDCKRQDDALGANTVLHTVLAQRNLVRGLLSECPTTLRPRLLSGYSDMSSSAGFYFLELNDFDSALHYCEQARGAAHDAGNTDLGIYALCGMSYTASWSGKAHAGIDFAAAAQSLASKTDDALLRVSAGDKAARAYATDGQYDACVAECERAQRYLASAGEVSPASPAYWIHEGLLASEKSDYLLRLGKPREAATSANTGLALFDKSFVGSLAFCTIFLGNAHLQSGEIDEAARVVGNAAGLAAQTRSARLVTELRTTRARMQPWQNTQAVTTLDDQLAAYGLVSSSHTH
ncbi:MAG: helix-turn-helix domain-containing protein [Pseudonocardiaceae bacterium]